MVDTIPPLEDARAAFLRKAARDNPVGQWLLPFGNLYEVEEEEIVPHTGATIRPSLRDYQFVSYCQLEFQAFCQFQNDGSCQRSQFGVWI